MTHRHPSPTARASRLLLLSLTAWLLCWLTAPLPAQQDPPPPAAADAADAADAAAEPTSEAEAAYQRFRNGTLDLATLAEVLPQMVDAERRSAIRTKLLDSKNPPRADLVALLQHLVLAVRLGALELLEELASGDLAYNPWLPADAPENRAAFARWQSWAGEPASARPNTRIYSDDQRRGYLRDILGEDADKASRARRMLEAEGLAALGFLESFLAESPTLTAAARAKIREAQYQITLTRQLGDQAALTARHLAFGSRDQLLAALATTRGAGLLALPILRDFITHPDPLARETAIESLLIVGGEQAVSVVAPLLAKESDVNVIHGALRRLKDLPCPATQQLVTALLAHPDEDLLVSAIQTALSLDGSRGSDSAGRNQKALEDAIVATLHDPRWRVRAAALEYVAKKSLPKAKAASLALLDDSDAFVRFAAIKAVSALQDRDALPKFKAMFLADESMAGPVIEGYGALKCPLPDDLLAKLDAALPDAKLAAIRAVESSESLVPVLLRYAADPDIDVACAALRIIAGSETLLKKQRPAALVVAALRSNNPAKIEAVLERLELPESKIDPQILAAIGAAANAGEVTALDPLYDGFLKPAGGTTTNPREPNIPAAQAELLRELTRFTTADTPASTRFRAAVNLAKAGQDAGYAALLRDLPTFTTAQKIACLQALYQPSHRDALKLIEPLLRDPVTEVRQAAAQCALGNEKARGLIELVLNELFKPDARLQAPEVYGYRFISATKAAGNRKLVSNWCLATLNSKSTRTPVRILATITAENLTTPTIIEALRLQCKSPDVYLRRAGWHALLTMRPAEVADSAAAIAADREAFVRECLPIIVSQQGYWSHRFSDTAVEDAGDSFDRSKTRSGLSADLRALLERMAAHDPAPVVRFQAGFALLCRGVPTDLDNLAAVIARLPEDVRAREQVSSWLSTNANRATPALSPLLAVIPPSEISRDRFKILLERIQPQQAKGFATFASLAQSAPPPNTAGQPALVADNTPPATVKRHSLPLIFFYKPGCPECTKVKQELSRLQQDHPLLKITELNILDASATVLNQALCVRLGVPSVNHSVSPAVFTQAGFLVRQAITPRALADLLDQTAALSQDDSWLELSSEETQAAATEVTRRYQAFTLPVVVGAGLLDGLNPCAFATIIFFYPYLRIARRTPREMLLVGAAFIAAVFIAYLAAGLLLHGLLGSLNQRFAGLQRILNHGFGALALIAAFLSFRDASRARHGRLGDMTLQLPGVLKDRIRSVVRSGTRARHFVAAAFISGLLISMLELACTGQVYAPIIYQIQRGQLDAMLWLVVYNLAFISPLVTIFLLTYGGLRNESLIAFQAKHTATVKIALGLLFLVLAAFIWFGPQLLG